MSKGQTRPQDVSARGLIASLGRPRSINWRTHVIFAVLAIMSGLTFDLPRLGGGWQVWLLISLFGYFATVTAIELLSLIIGKPKWQKSKPFAVLFILLTAGLIRGLAIGLAGRGLDVVPEEDFLFRALGAPAFVVFCYVISNLVVSSRLDYREVVERLVSEEAELERSRNSFGIEIARLQTELKFRIQELIAPSVWELGKLIGDAKLSRDASLTIAALRGLNEAIIRPMSKTLSAQPNNGHFTSKLTAVKLGRAAFPNLVLVGQSIPIPLVALSTIVLTFSSRSAQADVLSASFVSVVSVSLLVGILGIFRNLTKNLELPTGLAALMVAGVGALIGLSTSVLLSLSFLDLNLIFVGQAVSFTTLNLLLHFALSIFQKQRQDGIELLGQVVEDLRVITAQLRQQAWLYQKMLASQLHGPMQAVLQSAAFRLARLEHPSAAELETVLIDVNKAVAGIGQFDYLEGTSVRQSLIDMREVWEGVARIEFDFDDSVSAALEIDPMLARCFLEVLREAITNAIKHGAAQSVKAHAKLGSDRLELTVSNDGGPVLSGVPGYGSEILKELTLGSSLEYLAGLTTFRAQIPLGRQGAQLVRD